MLAQGYDPEQAETYGTLIGVSEMALQYVLGGISKLGGVSSEQLLTKITGIENGLLRASAALGIKGLNEVTEEELQLVLQPVYRSIVFGEDYDAPTIEEYVYTAVVSFAMLGVMEAGDIASYARNRPVQAVEWDFSDTSDFAAFGETDTAVDPDGNMGYDGSVTDGRYNRIPDNTSITGHIFRDAEGHIPDTPENRRLLESVANSEESFLGYDKYGNAWYTRKLPDGTSVWVQVRNGNIFEGGINKTPKKWNPDTGLKKQ